VLKECYQRLDSIIKEVWSPGITVTRLISTQNKSNLADSPQVSFEDIASDHQIGNEKRASGERSIAGEKPTSED